MTDDAFEAIKQQLRDRHEGFIALLMVLREHGLSADVAATVALQLGAAPDGDSWAKEHLADAAAQATEAAAVRVEQGNYDIHKYDTVQEIVEETVRQAVDKIRCGLKA